MSLESITLVFENCETLVVPMEHIANIYAHDIVDSIGWDDMNGVRHHTTSKWMEIRFKPSFLTTGIRTCQDLTAGHVRVWMHADITWVVFNYADGKKLEIGIQWPDDEDNHYAMSNSYQSTEMEGEHMVVTIKVKEKQ